MGSESLKNLLKDFHLLALPSTLWGVHIDPNDQFAAILHIAFSLDKLTIDKSVLLTCETDSTVKAQISVNDELVNIPNSTSKIRAISDLTSILYTLHDVGICVNAGSLEFPRCLKYISNSEGSGLCAACKIDSQYALIYNSHQTNTEYNQECIKTEPEPQPLNESSLESPKYYPSEDHFKERFACDICEESFNSQDTLTKHKNSHSNKEKSFLCTTCGKAFLIKAQLEEHTFTHLKDRPYKCEVCDKAFAKKYNMTVHARLHSGEKPYVCSQCGRTFNTRSNLSTHVKSIHSNEKNHKCEICGKSFVHPRILRVHMRKHTGERPFTCNVCGKVFAKNIHLTIHARTHTGEKPFVCNVCGKGFGTTGNLNNHMRNSHKINLEVAKT